MKQNQPNQDHLHYGISLKLYFENKAFGPGMSALLREWRRQDPSRGLHRA